MTNLDNAQPRFYVETDASIDDIHKLGFYPQWDYDVKKFYFYDPNLVEALQAALRLHPDYNREHKRDHWDIYIKSTTNISTTNTAFAKKSIAKTIAINYKYLKFIIQAITYVEWILGLAVLIGIVTFIAENHIYVWEHLRKVISEIIVVLMGLVIILFAITIGKVYLKNQYNNKK